MKKSETMRYWLGGIAILVIFLNVGCALTTVREHPDFASAKRKVNTVAVIPPEVEIVRLVFDGDNQRIPQREREVFEQLKTQIPQLLKERGYEVRDSQLESLHEDQDDIRYELEQLKTAYKQASKELYEKPAVPPEEAYKYNVSVGPIINQFAERAGVDALVIVYCSGFEKSGGLQAKEIVASALLAALTGSYVVSQNQGASIEAALIDGTSGDILWSNASGGQLSVEAVIKNVIAELPDKGAAPTAAVQPEDNNQSEMGSGSE